MSSKLVDVPEIKWGDVIRKEPSFCQELIKICREVGPFYMVETPLVKHRKNMLQQAIDLFKMPCEKKELIHISRSLHFRGYSSLAEEITLGFNDMKETYDYGLEQTPPNQLDIEYNALYGKNLWPDETDLPQFKTTLDSFLACVQEIGTKLLECILHGLQIQLDIKQLLGNPPFSLARLICYPAADKKLESVNGIGTHTDYGFFVFLMQNEITGLKVQLQDKNWITVPHQEGKIAVLLGDMLQVLTDDYLSATLHRVDQIISDNNRYSMVGFFEPSPNVEIVPQKIHGKIINGRKSLVYGQHLHQALKRSFPIAGTKII